MERLVRIRRTRCSDYGLHSIPLYPGTRPHASKLALYSPEERQWQLDNLPVSSEFSIGNHHHLSWFITARHVDSALDFGLSDIKYPHKPNVPESIKQVLLRIGLPVQMALVGSKPTELRKLYLMIRYFLFSGRVIKALSHQYPFECSVPKGKGGCSTVWNRSANHLPRWDSSRSLRDSAMETAAVIHILCNYHTRAVWRIAAVYLFPGGKQ